MTASTRRIAVLMGGYSKEREVSLVSGQAASKALRARGFAVVRGLLAKIVND